LNILHYRSYREIRHRFKKKLNLCNLCETLSLTHYPDSSWDPGLPPHLGSKSFAMDGIRLLFYAQFKMSHFESWYTHYFS